MGYFLEAAATERDHYHHSLEIIVLDRPNLIGGEQVQGPVSDPGHDSYTNYMPLPVRHGLTLGELARYINGEHRHPQSNLPQHLVPLDVHLTVIPMQNWPAPNTSTRPTSPGSTPAPISASAAAAILYPAVGLSKPPTSPSAAAPTTPSSTSVPAGPPPSLPPKNSTHSARARVSTTPT